MKREEFRPIIFGPSKENISLTARLPTSSEDQNPALIAGFSLFSKRLCGRPCPTHLRQVSSHQRLSKRRRFRIAMACHMFILRIHHAVVNTFMLFQPTTSLPVQKQKTRICGFSWKSSLFLVAWWRRRRWWSHLRGRRISPSFPGITLSGLWWWVRYFSGHNDSPKDC